MPFSRPELSRCIALSVYNAMRVENCTNKQSRRIVSQLFLKFYGAFAILGSLIMEEYTSKRICLETV